MFNKKRETPEEYLNDGINLFNSKCYEEALVPLDKYLDKTLQHPTTDDGKAYYYKGLALDALGRYEDAKFAYSMAIHHDPANTGKYEELRNKAIQNIGYLLQYVGGHPAFPGKLLVTFRLMDDHLDILRMDLKIPYDRISRVTTKTSQDLSVAKLLFVGLLAFAWKDDHLFLVIDFNDETMDQSMVFDGDDAVKVMPLLYHKVVDAKVKPERVSQ
jgi:tetratricopeptide (TPR) repeat protein